jgi:hypothetical protein
MRDEDAPQRTARFVIIHFSRKFGANESQSQKRERFGCPALFKRTLLSQICYRQRLFGRTRPRFCGTTSTLDQRCASEQVITRDSDSDQPLLQYCLAGQKNRTGSVRKGAIDVMEQLGNIVGHLSVLRFIARHPDALCVSNSR